jgi:hypothetical protein
VKTKLDSRTPPLENLSANQISRKKPHFQGKGESPCVERHNTYTRGPSIKYESFNLRSSLTEMLIFLGGR